LIIRYAHSLKPASWVSPLLIRHTLRVFNKTRGAGVPLIETHYKIKLHEPAARVTHLFFGHTLRAFIKTRGAGVPLIETHHKIKSHEPAARVTPLFFGQRCRIHLISMQTNPAQF